MTDFEKKANNAPGQEVVARLMDRRGFLKTLAAAGAGAAIGSNALLRETLAQKAPPSRGNFKPTDLHFSIEEQYRPVSLLAENCVELRDGFDTLASATNYQTLSPAPEGDAGSATFGSGKLQVSGDSYFALFKSDTGQRAPFTTIILDVERFAGSGGEHDAVYAGLVKDADNYVVAWYDDAKKQAGFDVVVDGAVNSLGTVEVDLPAPARFAFVLNENLVISLSDTGDGFEHLLRRNVEELVDLREPATLSEYKNGFGARASSGTIVLDGVEAGYYGEVGVRDENIVTYSDGTPFIEDGKLYFTQTNAGVVGDGVYAGGAGVRAAHFGVYTLDLSDYAKLEEVGKIFFQRDGKLLGDHAGHVTYDEDTESFHVYASTWGDFRFEPDSGVQVSHVQVGGTNLLEGVHVLEADLLPIPTQTEVYDPHVARIRGDWWIGYVETRQSPFGRHYPVLAKASGPDFNDLTIVGKDPSVNSLPGRVYEGTKLQKVGGEWYVFVSGFGDYRIYDLGMNFVGNLDAPYLEGTIPHPMVVPIPEDGRTRWIMITFDGETYDGLGTTTRSNFYVMEAAEITRGYEFPPRPLP
ncbi:MAG: twin-arginine translocation signal domain-containing protein [Rubrobacteraceae bacterium]